MNPTRLAKLGALLLALAALGSSSLPVSNESLFVDAAAICHGTVRRVESFVDPASGFIRTRALIEVHESFKGTFPSIVAVIHHGGTVGETSVVDGFAPQFRVGEERLLFLKRDADDTLFSVAGTTTAPRLQRVANLATAGKPAPLIAPQEALLAHLRSLTASLAAGEDVTDQAGFLTLADFSGGNPAPPSIAPPGHNIDATNGFPSRFTAPDRGEPIGYLVDAQFLPPGITLAQGTNAVAAAFNAWGAVTGIRFVFQGLTNFGNAAGAATNLNGSSRNDSRIRVQLHDTFNFSPGGTVLGVGGRASTFSLGASIPTAWGVGANVKGFEFNRSTRGFVVLEHTNTTLSDPLALAEVLCHEIGHVLNLAHSSELTNEPNTVLSNAVMYFRLQGGGRGATLGSYDGPAVQASYSPTNPPPWTFDRVMDVVNANPTQPNVDGVNRLRLQPFDLFSPSNTANFTIALSNATASFGSFSVSGLTLTYAPTVFGDGPRQDPVPEGPFYDSVYARVSDGTNASPWVIVRVISLSSDTAPTTSDGIPDNWMITYFGNANPAAGANRGATNDFDGDGFSNFQEYLLGSDPTDSRSNLRILTLQTNSLTFQARPYENYELFASTNLTNWARLPIGTLPTTTNGTFTNLFATNAVKTFYRVGRVP